MSDACGRFVALPRAGFSLSSRGIGSERTFQDSSHGRLDRSGVYSRMRSTLQRSGRLPDPTHEQIAALAHELWTERGSPEGSDVDIWLEAERQLRGTPARTNGGDPIPADPDRIDPDDDPAINPRIDRELKNIGGRPGARSATAFDV